MSSQAGNTGARVTVATLSKMKAEGEKFASLTAYDSSFATALERGGVDVILVGDSLGMVLQGHDTTVPVTMDQMVYHTRCVSRGCERPLLMSDLPFMSYSSVSLTLENARRLVQEGGAEMVKIEGGSELVDVVHALSQNGVPVCAHLGLTPQSVHKLGGYKVQGRSTEAAEVIERDALALVDAGADVILLECVPNQLGARITKACAVPVIGIGAGPHCDGQILVLHDMIGVFPGKRPKFSKDFLHEGGSIDGAIRAFVSDVKSGEFPSQAHGYG